VTHRLLEEAAQSNRRRFIDAVHAELAGKAVRHVFLHSLDGEHDSDVDVVVDRAGLDVVDTLVRCGRLGRLVQRLDYDVPWCRFYVIETPEPQPRFRKLDVVADPFGIGRYSDAPAVALAHAEKRDGLSEPSPAAQCLYLAVKRSRKRMYSRPQTESLRQAYALDPDGAAELLESHLGNAGSALAEALRADQALAAPLHEVERKLKRLDRTGPRLARRAGYEAIRTIRRAVRPTGLVVCLAGPDGAGKSMLAGALETAALGPFRRTERRHLGPGLLPPPGRLLGRSPGDFSQPHSRAPSGPVGSVARIAYLAADALAGWLPRMALPRVRSTLVVLERGWNDLQVDPRRYRLSTGTALARIVGRALPKPDLTLLLAAPADVIAARKDELTTSEIAGQLDRWRELGGQTGAFVEIDASEGEDSVVEQALNAIGDHLAARAGELSQFAPAVRCLGGSHAHGTPYSVVRGGGRVRWLLPRRLGAPGPAAAGLYRAGTVRHALGATALEVVQRVGGLGVSRVVLDETVGVAPELAAVLGLDHVELAVLLPTDPARTSRVVVAALRAGRPVALAKVAPAGSGELERELRVLLRLESVPLASIETPRLIASFVWCGLDVLVTTLVPIRGSTSRPLGQVEEQALVDLAHARSELLPAVGAEDGWLVHGDFSGWNSARIGSRTLALWDWEWAHAGLPLEDYFHWQTQRLVHFGKGSGDALVRAALSPDKRLRTLCARIDVEPQEAAPSLAASLATRIDRLSAGGNEAELRLNRELLTRLDGRS
jgi:hypothetical protein